MNMEVAMHHLIENHLSIVVARDSEILYTSKDRGILPIYTLYTTAPELLKNSIVADKVIGRGAAVFLVDAGVKAIYGRLVSKQALDVIPNHIEVRYDILCDFIQNRDKTGLCPVETLSLNTRGIDDLNEAVSKFLDSLKQGD